MKKMFIVTALVAALLAGVAATAEPAAAFPTKTTSCSACHGSSTAVAVTVTFVSRTATTAKYKVKVSSAKAGKKGWAVFLGTRNLKRATAATGTFTVPRHKTYRVWGVNFGQGARYKTLIVK